MEIQVTHENGYILAETMGVIDDSAADVFAAVLHPLLAARGARLVLDLSQSPRINSVGIAALVRLACDANTHGGRLVLAAAPAFVSGVLAVTKLDRFFETAESVSLAGEKVLQPSP